MKLQIKLFNYVSGKSFVRNYSFRTGLLQTSQDVSKVEKLSKAAVIFRKLGLLGDISSLNT